MRDIATLQPSSKGDHEEDSFFTHERYLQEQANRLESPRGQLLIANCRSGAVLAHSMVKRYTERIESPVAQISLQHVYDVDFQFSDTETCVRLRQDASGYDVFLLQALFDPIEKRTVDENYMAFLIAARAFREWGANHVTAILPYLAYARQDKPTRDQHEPTTAKLMADLTVEAGIDRLVTWHPHCNQIHGFYGSIPVHMLEPTWLFVSEFQQFRNREDTIIVSPDAGASKLVTQLGRRLGLTCAIASKHRPRPEEAVVSEVIGDFEGKRVALVLDDIISSGGTIDSLIRKLIQDHGIEEVYLGTSHNLCTDRAYDYLVDLHKCYGLKEVIVTDSIPQTEKFLSLPFLSVRSLADHLSRVINRIHYHRSVSDLLY